MGFKDIKKVKVKIPAAVNNLLKQRKKARKENDFRKADQLRTEIKNLGFDVRDTKDGPTLLKKS